LNAVDSRGVWGHADFVFVTIDSDPEVVLWDVCCGEGDECEATWAAVYDASCVGPDVCNVLAGHAFWEVPGHEVVF